MIHALIVLLVFLAILSVILWGISQMPGIPPIVKTVVYVVAGVLILLWLLSAVGGPAIPVR